MTELVALAKSGVQISVAGQSKKYVKLLKMLQFSRFCPTLACTTPIDGSADEYDEDETRPTMKRSTYANDLNYSDDDSDFLLNDADLQEDFLVLDDMITKKKSHIKADGKRRGNMIEGGPPQQDTRNMTEEEKKRYKAIRKVYTDGLRMERLKREWLGILFPQTTSRDAATPSFEQRWKWRHRDLKSGTPFQVKIS